MSATPRLEVPLSYRPAGRKIAPLPARSAYRWFWIGLDLRFVAFLISGDRLRPCARRCAELFADSHRDHRPMPILDRYLLRQFVQIFLICFCSLVGLYIVIDAFSNLDDHIRNARQHGGLLALLSEYYGYRTIGFFDSTSGILTLIAAMFTVATFQRFNELTAIQAAGVPKWRVLRPVIVAVFVIASLAAVNREVVIPNIRERFTLNAQDLSGTVGKAVRPRRDNQTGVLINGKATFANRKRIGKPNFVLPWQLGEYGTQLIADDAFFLPADEDHPSGYLLKGVETPRDLAKKPSLSLDDKPVILTPHDYKWLDADQCFVVSGVTFEHLAASDDWRRYASLVELVDGLHNPSLNFGADVRVSVHSRIVQPMLDVTLLFLGLPLILSRSSRNVFIAIGLCVVVVVVFYLMVLGCQAMGTSYMVSPALAAWLPLLISVPTAMAMSQPLRE